MRPFYVIVIFMDKTTIMKDKRDNIYIYFWENLNTIYIGRTINPKSRHYQHKHKEREKTYQFSAENSVEHPRMIIIENDLTIDEGSEREKYWIRYYKENTTYNVLNKSVGGSIGNMSAMTEEERKKRKEIQKERARQRTREWNSTHIIEKKEKDKIYRETHKEQISKKNREYREKNNEVIKEKRKIYRDTHKTEIKQYKENHKEELTRKNKEYRDKHREERNTKQREYYQKHKEEIKRKQRERYEESKRTGGRG